MNLIRFIIHRRVAVSMFFIALTGLGVISFNNMPMELYPNSELPMLIVQIQPQLEVDPSYMENQGIIPLEGAIGSLAGIEKIESFAEQRRGTIYVYYTQDTNIKYATLKLQEKVDLIKSSLPEEFNISVNKVDTQQMSNQFMALQVLGGGGEDRIRYIVDQEVAPELENIDGIASVNVFGGREKSVEIILDDAACDAYDMTVGQIRNALRQNNQDRIFVGQAVESSQKYAVHVTAEYASINDLRHIVLRRSGPVLLSDVADVYLGVKEETTYSRVNGKDAVTIQLIRDSQANLIDLSHITQNVISELNSTLDSQGVEILIQNNEADLMEDNLHQMMSLALQGGLFAILILWLFLRNARLVVTVAVAIPISIFTAFFLFYLFDITLNSLTLVGMVLAIGMLLDNSVVVLENIYRLKSMGKDDEDATIRGTQEVWRSIFAATATTVTVFLPFLFAEDFLTKLIGHHVGISIIATLSVSLVIALLLIPMFTFYSLSRSAKNKQANSAVFQKVSQNQRFIQIYTVLLKAGLRFPARTVIGTLVVFFLAIFLSLATSMNTLQEVETGRLTLYITMPGGSTLEATDLVVREVESRLEDLEEKESMVSNVYEEEASISITLLEDYEKVNNQSIEAIKTDLLERLDDIGSAEIDFEEPVSSTRYRGGGGGGGRGNPGGNLERLLGIGTESENIVIKGNDFDQMRNVADDIQYYLEDLDNIQFVRQNISDNRPEMHLYFDNQALFQFGVELSDIGAELNTFQNEFGANISYKIGSDEVDIVLRSGKAEDETEKTLEDLKDLDIVNQDDGTAKLQDLGQIVFGSGMSRIQRVNQEKQIEVMYRFLSEVSDSKDLLLTARQEVDDIIANLVIPSGIAVEVVHEESDFDAFYFLIGAAFLLIYMILAAVFESFLAPVVIIFSIPLAAIGSLLALTITGHSLFNANTLMGFLILLGVVVNNGIIYLDYTRILRDRGYRLSRALITAGQARVRPILITAITTIVAMLPLAMSREAYVANIGAPFAVTIIGGLSLSTLFTLVLIPTLYFGLQSAIAWLRQLSWINKSIQAALLVLGIFFILTQVDDLLWQFASLLGVLIGIPATTFFVLNSLRAARAQVIDTDASITIRIQNMVKVYDRGSRFIREWQKGKTISERTGPHKTYTSLREFSEWIWQLPLLAFLIYFGFFYLNAPFWVFVTIVMTYLYLLSLIREFEKYLKNKADTNSKQWLGFLAAHGQKSIFWGFPLFSLFSFFLRWQDIPAILTVGILWMLALSVYVTAQHIHHQEININRLTGRFANVRRLFYQFVLVIPVIGRKRTPFRALNRATFEIGSGMFGLLGPNGAGKTTLMRIICGVLEQTYGRVWINGIDTLEKREELQGLIGYLPQEFGTYENMSAYEFLHYQAILKNITDQKDRENRITQVLKQVNMLEKQHDKIGSFSGGMKQRIGIAQILLHLPRILVVDEPTAGLDPWERIRFRNLLVELSRERIVIFSTHIIEDISSSCNRVAVLNRGNLCYLGNPAAMTKIAEGHVWQWEVPAGEFESLRKELRVIHHMRDGDNIRMRCLADSQPSPDAKEIRPTLEDAYLYLLRDRGCIEEAVSD